MSATVKPIENPPPYIDRLLEELDEVRHRMSPFLPDVHQEFSRISSFLAAESCRCSYTIESQREFS